MTRIRILTRTSDLEAAARVLREANATVAEDLGFTRENAPTNPAFTEAGTLAQELTHDREFYVLEADNEIAGIVAIEKAPNEDGLYYIERLAVLPKHRHKGYGSLLMDYAAERAAEKRGRRVSIAIINENTVLKNWYITLGFEETGIRKFDHLPFTVCFMQKELA